MTAGTHVPAVLLSVSSLVWITDREAEMFSSSRARPPSR